MLGTGAPDHVYELLSTQVRHISMRCRSSAPIQMLLAKATGLTESD